jgi:preprotein translocase subunit SecB
LTDLDDAVENDPIAEYGKVVDSAELETISLVNLNFSVQPRYFEKQSDAELGYEINVAERHYNRERNSAMAVVECSVSASFDDDVVWHCEASYVVAYSIAQDCDTEAVTAFINRVGVFACYPYFRSMVANVDWAAGTRLPPLPVHREVRVAPVKKKKVGKKKSSKA